MDWRHPRRVNISIRRRGAHCRVDLLTNVWPRRAQFVIRSSAWVITAKTRVASKRLHCSGDQYFLSREKFSYPWQLSVHSCACKCGLMLPKLNPLYLCDGIVSRWSKAGLSLCVLPVYLILGRKLAYSLTLTAFLALNITRLRCLRALWLAASHVSSVYLSVSLAIIKCGFFLTHPRHQPRPRTLRYLSSRNWMYFITGNLHCNNVVDRPCSMRNHSSKQDKGPVVKIVVMSLNSIRSSRLPPKCAHLWDHGYSNIGAILQVLTHDSWSLRIAHYCYSLVVHETLSSAPWNWISLTSLVWHEKPLQEEARQRQFEMSFLSGWLGMTIID